MLELIHDPEQVCSVFIRFCFFQKPYLTLGSLRAQMVYPRPAHDLSTSPTLLETILEHVQLNYLSKRLGGLETTRDWQDELSLGEQQVYPATVAVAPLTYNCEELGSYCSHLHVSGVLSVRRPNVSIFRSTSRSLCAWGQPSD